jgi:hypothetical protein
MAILTVGNKPQDDVDLDKKPVASWSNIDFVNYYLKCYNYITGKVFPIVPPIKIAAAGRIKRFRGKYRIAPEHYKRFIDFLFEHKFTKTIDANSFYDIVNENLFIKINKQFNDSTNK